jgi:hypothetical protein
MVGKDSGRDRARKLFMRKLAMWAGVPGVLAASGVTLWFILVPGRSGAG